MTTDIDLKKNIEILNQRFYLLLEDFKKNFILHKENVRYELNRKKFEASKDQLQNFYKEIVILDNTVENKTNSAYKQSISEKKENKHLKTINNKLKKQLSELEHGDKTSQQMYNDTKQIYLKQYIYFLIIIFGLIVLTIFLYLAANEEPYKVDVKYSLATKIVNSIIITFLVYYLAWRSLGIDITDPIYEFLEERGWFQDISLNF